MLRYSQSTPFSLSSWAPWQIRLCSSLFFYYTFPSFIKGWLTCISVQCTQLGGLIYICCEMMTTAGLVNIHHSAEILYKGNTFLFVMRTLRIYSLCFSAYHTAVLPTVSHLVVLTSLVLVYLLTGSWYLLTTFLHSTSQTCCNHESHLFLFLKIYLFLIEG